MEKEKLLTARIAKRKETDRTSLAVEAEEDVRSWNLELRHLQDLAASLRLGLDRGLLAQQLSHQPQGFYFFLQAHEFGFFAAKYFHGILHMGSG